MGIEQLLKEKRKEILAIAERHGAYNIRIFGSVARGEATPDSDIDLLVEVGKKHSFFFPGGLIHDLELLLGRRVQVVTEKALHHSIRDQVMHEAIAI